MARKRAAPDPASAPGARTPAAPDPGAYERAKEEARSRRASMSLAGRDIGPPPPVVNPARKSEAERCFQAFCEHYFPLTFTLAWSADHLKVIGKIEQAVLHGGLFAFAMARGSGKSSLCQCASLWALLYGHRRFVCLIGPEQGLAENLLLSIKTDLQTNDLLAADFPEVCHPVLALDGIANRCAGQLCQGRRTHITWKSEVVVLPSVAGSRASAGIIKVAGITGQVRGMLYKRPDGKPARPDLVVLDDPQTDSSARSPTQCEARESTLKGAVLGLAGPGEKIAGFMPCTVVRPDDMADRILDQAKHPQWGGERMAMVYAWPANEALWLRYAEIRADGLRDGDRGAAATEFYAANREAMDAGAEVAWPERHNPDELSAIQNAWNLRLDMGEAAFWAECQNQPLPARREDAAELTADQIAEKVNNLARGLAPVGATRLTAFIDVQQSLLWWVVCGWGNDFTGHVLDYGSWPDQQRPYFTLADARATLQTTFPNHGLEGAIYAGLDRLCAELLGRPWRQEGGAELRVERCLIDASWGNTTDLIYRFCRQATFAGVVMPSHGRGIGVARKPMSQYGRVDGDRRGLNWLIPAPQGKRVIRHVSYDTNFWKSFLFARLATALGDPGCLSLFGEDARTHRMFAEQLKAEYRVEVETKGGGRRVDEWMLKPGKPDNHLLDCVTGAAVAASIQGCVLAGTGTPQAQQPGRISFKEMQARKRGGR